MERKLRLSGCVVLGKSWVCPVLRVLCHNVYWGLGLPFSHLHIHLWVLSTIHLLCIIFCLWQTLISHCSKGFMVSVCHRTCFTKCLSFMFCCSFVRYDNITRCVCRLINVEITFRICGGFSSLSSLELLFVWGFMLM